MKDNLRRGVPLLILPVAVLVALGVAKRGRGEQPNRAPLTSSPESRLTPAYVSASKCSPCHDHPRSLTSDLVSLDEFETWAHRDPHSKAHARLGDERSTRMAQLLWKTDSAERPECLNCHAPGHAYEDSRTRGSLRSEGVSCVACHGSYLGWVEAHGLDPNWAKLSAEVKQKEFGLTDLRDAGTRAQVCLSCHVGDAQAGKVVTHAMYAAGHPPLPSIEVATFSNALPPHWLPPEKVRRFQDQPEVRRLYHYEPRELGQTRLVVEAAAVSLRESTALLAAEMKGRLEHLQNAPAQQPDFARFDCYACHHELQPKGWRPTRGFPATPGRVPVAAWPDALVRLAIAAAAADSAQAQAQQERFDRHVAELQKAVGVRQYGEPVRVLSAATALESWSDALARSLREPDGKRIIDRARAEGLLRQLCEVAQEGTPDYDSARQMAWAFGIIYHELNPSSSDAQVEAELRSLDRALDLTLRAGDQTPIEKALPERLQRIAEYDPGVFQRAFRAIASRLPALKAPGQD